MRGTKKSDASKHPLRLLRIFVYKGSGELLFKKPLWLIVSGENVLNYHCEIFLIVIVQSFDLEHFFRFGKNKLLMDKSQTPDVDHEEAWWQLTMIAYTQLYLARDLAKNTPTPWEKYLPTLNWKRNIANTSTNRLRKNYSGVWHACKTTQYPKKAPGRQIGEKQVARMRYPIVQKSIAEQLIAASG